MRDIFDLMKLLATVFLFGLSFSLMAKTNAPPSCAPNEFIPGVNARGFCRIGQNIICFSDHPHFEPDAVLSAPFEYGAEWHLKNPPNPAFLAPFYPCRRCDDKTMASFAECGQPGKKTAEASVEREKKASPNPPEAQPSGWTTEVFKGEN